MYNAYKDFGGNAQTRAKVTRSIFQRHSKPKQQKCITHARTPTWTYKFIYICSMAVYCVFTYVRYRDIQFIEQNICVFCFPCCLHSKQNGIIGVTNKIFRANRIITDTHTRHTRTHICIQAHTTKWQTLGSNYNRLHYIITSFGCRCVAVANSLATVICCRSRNCRQEWFCWLHAN